MTKELTDEEVFGTQKSEPVTEASPVSPAPTVAPSTTQASPAKGAELTDEQVFGKPKEMTDADVFGSAVDPVDQFVSASQKASEVGKVFQASLQEYEKFSSLPLTPEDEPERIRLYAGAKNAERAYRDEVNSLEKLRPAYEQAVEQRKQEEIQSLEKYRDNLITAPIVDTLLGAREKRDAALQELQAQGLDDAQYQEQAKKIVEDYSKFIGDSVKQAYATNEEDKLLVSQLLNDYRMSFQSGDRQYTTAEAIGGVALGTSEYEYLTDIAEQMGEDYVNQIIERSQTLRDKARGIVSGVAAEGVLGVPVVAFDSVLAGISAVTTGPDEAYDRIAELEDLREGAQAGDTQAATLVATKEREYRSEALRGAILAMPLEERTKLRDDFISQKQEERLSGLPPERRQAIIDTTEKIMASSRAALFDPESADAYGASLPDGSLYLTAKGKMDINLAVDKLVEAGKVPEAKADFFKNYYTKLEEDRARAQRGAVIETKSFQNWLAENPQYQDQMETDAGVSLAIDKYEEENNTVLANVIDLFASFLGTVKEQTRMGFVGGELGAIAASDISDEEKTDKMFEIYLRESEAMADSGFQGWGSEIGAITGSFATTSAAMLGAKILSLIPAVRPFGKALMAAARGYTVAHMGGLYAAQGYIDSVDTQVQESGYNSIKEVEEKDPELAQQINRNALRAMGDAAKISVSELLPIEALVSSINRITKKPSLIKTFMEGVVLNPAAEISQEIFSDTLMQASQARYSVENKDIETMSLKEIGQMYIGVLPITGGTAIGARMAEKRQERLKEVISALDEQDRNKKEAADAAIQAAERAASLAPRSSAILKAVADEANTEILDKASAVEGATTTGASVPETRTIAEAIRDKDTFVYQGMRGAITEEDGDVVFREFGTQNKYIVPVAPDQTLGEIEELEWQRKGQRRQVVGEPIEPTVVENRPTVVEKNPVVTTEEFDGTPDEISLPQALLEIEKSPILNFLADLFDTGDSRAVQMEKAEYKSGKRKGETYDKETETPVTELPEYYRQATPDQLNQAHRLIDSALRLIDTMDVDEATKDRLAEHFLLLDQDITNYEQNPEYQKYRQERGWQVSTIGETGEVATTATEALAAERELEQRVRAEAEAIERRKAAEARRAITPPETPTGTRIKAAAYVAPDGTIYTADSHLNAMQKAADDGKITQADIAKKQKASSRETTEFGFSTESDSFISRDQAEALAKESGQILVETPETGRLHSNEVALDDFTPDVDAPPYIARAIVNREPISVEDVDRAGVELPKGWKVDGDVYVYVGKEQKKEPPSVRRMDAFSRLFAYVQDYVEKNPAQAELLRNKVGLIVKNLNTSTVFDFAVNFQDAIITGIQNRLLSALRRGVDPKKISAANLVRSALSDAKKTYPFEYKKAMDSMQEQRANGKKLDDILSKKVNEADAKLTAAQKKVLVEERRRTEAVARRLAERKMLQRIVQDFENTLNEDERLAFEYVKALERSKNDPSNKSKRRQADAARQELEDRVEEYEAIVSSVVGRFAELAERISGQKLAPKAPKVNQTANGQRVAAEQKEKQSVLVDVDAELSKTEGLTDAEKEARAKTEDPNLNNVGSWIKTLPAQSPIRRLMNQILKVNPSVANVPIQYVAAINGKYDGFFDPNVANGRIVLPQKPTQDITLLVAHEIVHAATLDKARLYDSRQYNKLTPDELNVFKELDNIRGAMIVNLSKGNAVFTNLMGIPDPAQRAVVAAQAVAEGKIGGELYALVNMAEFLANSINNVEFQKALDTVDPNIFRQIWNLIRRLFYKNTEPSSSVNALWNSIVAISRETKVGGATQIPAPSFILPQYGIENLPIIENRNDLKRLIDQAVFDRKMKADVAVKLKAVLDFIPEDGYRGAQVLFTDRVTSDQRNAMDMGIITPFLIRGRVAFDVEPDLPPIIYISTSKKIGNPIKSFLHENAHVILDSVATPEIINQARAIYDSLPISRQAVFIANYRIAGADYDTRFSEWFAESLVDYYEAKINEAGIEIDKKTLDIGSFDSVANKIYKKIVDLFSNERERINDFFDGVDAALFRAQREIARQAEDKIAPASVALRSSYENAVKNGDYGQAKLIEENAISRILNVLTPDLLKREYREANKTNGTYGHCYAASEALYHMLGGKASGLRPTNGRDGNGVVHWWVKSKDGRIIDPTATQYTSIGLNPPYEAGKGGGFLTKDPSRRAQTIINRINDESMGEIAPAAISPQDARYLELAQDPETNQEELQRVVEDAAKPATHKFIDASVTQSQRIRWVASANKQISFWEAELKKIPTKSQATKEYQELVKAWNDAGLGRGPEDVIRGIMELKLQPPPANLEEYLKTRIDLQKIGVEKELEKAKEILSRTPAGQDQTQFKTGEPTVVKVYHSTPFGRLTEFSDEMLGAFTGAPSATRAHFFAGSPDVSETYYADSSWLLNHKGFFQLSPDQKKDLISSARESLPNGLESTSEEIAELAESLFDIANYNTEPVENVRHDVFVRLDNPLVYDFKGAGYREVSFNDLLIQAEQGGHDGVIMANTTDAGPAATIDSFPEPVNIVAVLRGHSNQIKLADPITRDNQGNIIPLSQRFDVTRPEITFAAIQILPEEGGTLPPVTNARLEELGVRSDETQIVGTERTYKRILDSIVRKGISILDFGSGLGHGLKFLKNEAKRVGFEAFGYEPMWRPDRKAAAQEPDYIGFESLALIPDNSQDYVINNAVLNVVAEDVRAEIVKQMYDKLKAGGTLFLQARAWTGDVQKLLKNNQNMIVGPREIFVPHKQTFQKGFTSQELINFVQSQLPDAKVVRTQFGGVGIAVTKPQAIAPAAVSKPKISKVSDEYNASRVGTATQGKVKPTTQETNVSIATVKPENLKSQMDKLTEFIKGVKLPSFITSIRNPEKKRDAFIEFVADNLLALYEAFPVELRAAATRWYDGARKLAEGMAKDSGLTVEQSAGILAAFSPMKDWFQNVEMGIQFSKVYKNDLKTKITKSKFKEAIAEITNSSTPSARRGRIRLLAMLEGRSIDGLWKEAARNEAKANKIREQRKLGAKQYNALPETKNAKKLRILASWATRVVATQNYGLDYNVYTPDGDVLGKKLKKNSNVPQKMVWQSAVFLEKALSIAYNGSLENISANLGKEHKIRSFYNNIVSPNNPYGDTTIDTHAVNAGVLFPMGNKGKLVNAAFGGAGMAGGGNSGIYWLFHEAYRRAAARAKVVDPVTGRVVAVGIQPRQMQSITWEAIRGLFPDDVKRKKSFVEEIKEIWKNAPNARAARNRIVSRELRIPEWATAYTRSGRVASRTVAAAGGNVRSKTDIARGIRNRLRSGDYGIAPAAIDPATIPNPDSQDNTSNEAAAIAANRADAKIAQESIIGHSIMADEIPEELREELEATYKNGMTLEEFANSDKVSIDQTDFRDAVAIWLDLNGGLMPTIKIKDKKIERLEQGTPEAETVRMLNRAFTIYDNASESVEAGKEVTYKIGDIVSTWLRSGLGDAALRNAIVQFTNLDVPAAIAIAEDTVKQYSIQQRISDTKDRARVRMDRAIPAVTSRQKAEKERMIRLEQAAGTIDSIAEAIKLAYDVNVNKARVDRATEKKQIQEQLRQAKRIIRDVVPRQYLGEQLTTLERAAGLDGLKRVVEIAQDALNKARLDYAVKQARKAFDRAATAVRAGTLTPEAEVILRGFVDQYTKSGMSQKTKDEIAAVLLEYTLDPIDALKKLTTTKGGKQVYAIDKYIKRRGDLNSIKIDGSLGLEALREITAIVSSTLHMDKMAKGELAFNKKMKRDEWKKAIKAEIANIKTITKETEGFGPKLGGFKWNAVFKGARVENILRGLGLESMRKFVYENLALDAYNDELRNRISLKKKIEEAFKSITGLDVGTKDYDKYSKQLFELTGLDQDGNRTKIQVRRSELIDMVASLRDANNFKKAVRAGGFVIDRLRGSSKGDTVEITPESYVQIQDAMTEADLAMVDFIVNIYNNDLFTMLNDASIQTYGHGIKKTDGIYYPRNAFEWDRVTETSKDLDYMEYYNSRVDSVGHLKERTDEVNARLVAVDFLSRLDYHVTNDSRISAYLAIVQDINSILKDSEVMRPLEIKVGRDVVFQIREMVRQQTIPLPGLREGLINTLVGNAGIGILGFKIHAAMQNPVGIPIAMAYYGKDGLKYSAKAFAYMRKGFNRSEYMKMAEVLNKYTPYFAERYGEGGFVQEFTSGMAAGPSETRWRKNMEDKSLSWLEMTDKIGALARYKTAIDVIKDRTELAEGTEEFNRAVAREWNLMMFRSENTSHGADRTGWFQMAGRNPMFKIFIMFQSAVSKQYSLFAEAVIQAQQGGRENLQDAAMKMGFVAASVYMSLAISRLFYGILFPPDEDEEKNWVDTLGTLVSAPLAIVPVLGNTLQSMVAGWFSPENIRKPMQLDVISSFIFGTMEAADLAFKAVRQVGEGEIDTKTGDPKWWNTSFRAIEKGLNLLGIARGLPIGGILQSGKFVKRLGERVWDSVDGDMPSDEEFQKKLAKVKREMAPEPTTQEYAKMYFAVAENNQKKFNRAMKDLLAKNPNASRETMIAAIRRRPEFILVSMVERGDVKIGDHGITRDEYLSKKALRSSMEQLAIDMWRESKD